MAKPLELPIPYKRTTEGNEIWYYGGGKIAYTSLQDAYDNVDPAVRAGKTVGIIESGKVVEYIWHPSDLSNAGLVKKQSDVEFNGTANKIPKFDSTGKNIENSGIEDDSVGRAIKVDRSSWTFLPHAPHQLGGLVLENKVDDTVTTAVVYRSRNGVSSIEEVAYLSDISTPVDTSNLEEYTASTAYTEGENIFFTIDDEIFFYRVLQDFTSLDPVDIEAEITAGNLEKITEGKFIKVLDHDSTTKTIYTKYSAVKDPSSKVLYRAKQDADETIPLTNTTYWENITPKVGELVGVNAIDTSYTLILSDKGKLVTMDNAAALTLTVPANASVAFPIGTIIKVQQIGAGQLEILPDTGVTFNGISNTDGDYKIELQYGGAELIKTGTDTWSLMGNLEL